MNIRENSIRCTRGRSWPTQDTHSVHEENSMPTRTRRPRRDIIIPVTPTKIDENIIKYHKERLGRLPIVKTTRTPSGQILDWIPRESQCPQGRIATPPPSKKHTTQVAGVHAMAATFEMNDLRIERGPAGTVPLRSRSPAARPRPGRLRRNPGLTGSPGRGWRRRRLRRHWR